MKRIALFVIILAASFVQAQTPNLSLTNDVYVEFNGWRPLPCSAADAGLSCQGQDFSKIADVKRGFSDSRFMSCFPLVVSKATDASLIIRLGNVYASSEVNIVVMDADSGNVVFSEYRSEVNVENDVYRLVEHFLAKVPQCVAKLDADREAVEAEARRQQEQAQHLADEAAKKAEKFRPLYEKCAPYVTSNAPYASWDTQCYVVHEGYRSWMASCLGGANATTKACQEARPTL